MTHRTNVQIPDPFVNLATRAVARFVRTGETLSAPEPVPEPMRGQAGVFVSLKKSGHLRGCIGTFAPTRETIAHEIIANAIQSASADPRFPPVQEDELPHLTLSVDVLTSPEACDVSQLDPKRYGVLVESGWRRGLLLPALEGVDSVTEQVTIAKNKAGIGSNEPVRLSRFTVERHG